MFTGLVQDIGVLESVASRAEGVCLTIRTKLTSRLREGDSLCVNGVCLTVGAPVGECVVATAVPETLERSTLGRLRAGHRVNLEPALSLGEPLGGHLVQGHVDGRGLVISNGLDGSAWMLVVGCDQDILQYLVTKGSIAVDGMSLTVASLGKDRFAAAIVPHTLQKTVIKQGRPGDEVNLEVDILAKYVARLLGTEHVSSASIAESRITEQWLRERGF